MTREEVLEILENSDFTRKESEHGIIYTHLSSVSKLDSAMFYISKENDCMILTVYDSVKLRAVSEVTMVFRDIKSFKIDYEYFDDVIRISFNYDIVSFAEK